MFVSPTPVNTPALNAAGSKSPLEHVVIDVAEADHAQHGMPSLTLAPSVQSALASTMQKPQQRTISQYATRNVAGSGNASNTASTLQAFHSLSETPCRE